MRKLALALFLVLSLACEAVLAGDALSTGRFDAEGYGGPLYEPRYCDPSGHLPMSACLLANMNMAEDFLLRVIETKYGLGAFSRQRLAIQAVAQKRCESDRQAAVKRYKSGELIDFTYWSCLRGEYHKSALELIE